MEKFPATVGGPGHSYRLIIAPLLTFALFLGVGLYLVRQANRDWQRDHDHHLSSIAHSQAIALERHLSRSLAAAYILGEQVRYQNGQLANFEQLASDLISHLGGITNLQLAPDGVIEKIYPLAGHEQALGHNILRDDKRSRDARLAIDTREITLAGPFPLVQGGIGLVGRYPVFLPDTDSSKDKFWGFASVLILVDDLIKSTQLANLRQQGYQYRLWLRDSEAIDTDKYQFAGDMSASAAGAAHIASIHILNQTWQLEVALLKRPARFFGTSLMTAIALGVALLAGFLVYFLLRTPERLRLEVSKKTWQLENLAFFDQLTELPNRQLFMDRLGQAVRFSERQGNQFALLFIDLDGFKEINDRLGHQSGDLALQEAARRLLASVRSSDTVARMGGDEFTMLLNDITGDREQLSILTGRVLCNLGEPFTIGDVPVELSGSIGIAVYPEHGTGSEALLKQADQAMYRAKSEGHNRFRFAAEATP